MFKQSTKCLWKPWLRFRPEDQVHAYTWKGRLPLCRATPKLQQPAAPVAQSAGVIVFVIDVCSVCWLDNPLQSPFPFSPGCHFIFSSVKDDQIENVNVALGKERWWMGCVAEGWSDLELLMEQQLLFPLLDFPLGHIGTPWPRGAVRSSCWHRRWAGK